MQNASSKPALADECTKAAIIARAPLRIDFAGGGSDIPPFCDEAGGAVVNAAIDRYAWAALEPGAARDPLILRSLDTGEQVVAPSVPALRFDGTLDLLKAAVKALPHPGGLRLTVRTDAPAGSGLGASSAIVVAILAGLALLRGESRSPEELARLAYRVERLDLGCAGGWQDQYAAALGGLNCLRSEGGAVTVEPLPLDTGLAAEMARSLLLAYTGRAHVSTRIVAEIQAELRSGGRAWDALLGLKAAAQAQRQAYVQGDRAGFVAGMSESWSLFQRLHESCTNAEYERFFEAARQAGASGGKGCGAGGGGCAVFYCPQGTRERVRSAVEGLGGRVLEFAWEPRGAAAWATALGAPEPQVRAAAAMR